MNKTDIICNSFSMNKATILLIVIVFAITGCNNDKEKIIDKTQLDFSTTDDSEIYFKNVRQSSYELLELKEAGINIFRISERPQDVDYQVFTLALAHNWRMDKAYLFLELNDTLPGEVVKAIIFDEKSGTSEEIVYNHGKMQVQAAFVTDIYNAILEDKKIFWINQEGKEVPMLEKFNDREAFRKTAFDFYKLTRVIK